MGAHIILKGTNWESDRFAREPMRECERAFHIDRRLYINGCFEREPIESARIFSEKLDPIERGRQ